MAICSSVFQRRREQQGSNSGGSEERPAEQPCPDTAAPKPDVGFAVFFFYLKRKYNIVSHMPPPCCRCGKGEDAGE